MHFSQVYMDNLGELIILRQKSLFQQVFKKPVQMIFSNYITIRSGNFPNLPRNAIQGSANIFWRGPGMK